ncbi:chalcone isomerase family protein [Frigidibacter oleivorans]|uniref:hypothetical protein n=1 Tax=Frigidibacter oleivorans TaxID=2487129 RepID=UPI000F8DE7F7|nr:hypothetical protein [Frigidibacter oleivorans]
MPAAAPALPLLSRATLARAALPALIALALSPALSPAPARAFEAVVARAGIPDPAPIGAATLRWLGLPVYEGRLYTARGQEFDWTRPMALELHYLRGFSREDMLDATRAELERLEGPRPDHDALVEALAPCFRQVGRGDRFVAAMPAPDRLTFWFNGAPTCDIARPGIGPRFLSIWLSDNSRSASLSRQLRGEAN